MSERLTPKQERFAQAMVDADSQAEAYRSAYSADNMADATIHEAASRLMADSKIAARVEYLKDLRVRRHEATIDKVVAEYAKLAFLDIRKAFTLQGDLIPIADLDDETAAAIAGVEFEEVFEHDKESGRKQIGRIHKIKLIDKKGALDSLSRYLGMFQDKIQHSGTGPKGEILVDLTQLDILLAKPDGQ